MTFLSSRLRALASLLAGALLLAACGGGGELVSRFEPRRIVVFGDETSALGADGRKYGINALDASGALVCASNPLWVQSVAQSFRLPFAQCPTVGATAPPPSVDHAVNEARVVDAGDPLNRPDLTTQIDNHLAADTLGAGDLVLILAGMHDVLEQYALYDGSNRAALIAALEARGDVLAAQVRRIAAAGGKVVVSTVLDMGVTPFALKERADHAGDGSGDRAALLTDLTARLNARLRVGLQNASGRDIALVLGDELVDFMVKFPSSSGLQNVVDPACRPDTWRTTQCTSQTLVTLTGGGTASASTWLWADDIHLSAGGQAQLGDSATTRARNNPF